jgi:hypothetical protein
LTLARLKFYGIQHTSSYSGKVVQLGALQSAFKTQSEDAKVSHSTHKLAMVQPYFIWKQKLWLLVKFTF